ncbi:PREDICTED: C-type mannose receptor 2-like isoform X2 [Papilio polytes]|uniref:C-type mannose receptor 2-like isoform X2 n=1 Tax=Papilio polytes TaxID=76194 RepID=UPI000676400F|nr:PREDICTED: C-type mannose receptor 2-like isoform X2 [Papilio polytes]
MAYKKCLFILLFINSVFQAIDGQKKEAFFRDDYTYFEETNSFYKIHTIPRSWVNAKKRCLLEGATLFFPELSLEADVALGHLNDTLSTLPSIYLGIASVLTKGVFITVNGDSLRDVYNSWAPGEPNNYNDEEDCVVMRRDGKLIDVKCSDKLPFICKKTKIEVDRKWNEACNSPYLDYKYNEDLGRCYKFHLFPLSWKDALEACDAEQAYLAIINSQLEAEHLVNITALAPKDKVKGAYIRGAVHLGFSYDKTIDDWKTVMGETLEQAGYASWGNNQPDGGENERCGSMFYNGQLNDVSCTTVRCFFICERENKLLGFLNDKFGKD